jgi:hypothetical protein
VLRFLSSQHQFGGANPYVQRTIQQPPTQQPPASAALPSPLGSALMLIGGVIAARYLKDLE